MATRDATLARMRSTGIVAVVRDPVPLDRLELFAALIEGGVSVIEVTLTVPDAFELLRALRDRFAGAVTLGAGTVLDTESAHAAMVAGAEFFVSPVTTESVIRFARRHGKVSVPGAMTPTEILHAYELGGDVIKVYPAEVVTPAFFRAMRGPLSQVPLMPSAGIDLRLAGEFFAAGAVCVSVGRDLLVPELLHSGDASALAGRARQFARLVPASRTLP